MTTPSAGLQARMDKNDTRVVSANRDVAHNFKFVVEEVARRLTAGRRWDKLDKFVLANAGGDDAELGKACQAFITFVATAAQNPKEDMFTALERSGFMQLSGPAQIAYLSVLGTVMAGIYYDGAKCATLGGEGPCDNMESIIAAGREAAILMTAPRWLRKWLKMKSRIKKAINAFRGT